MAHRNFESNGGYAAAEDVQYVGVDGCPGGWFSIGFSGAGDFEFNVSEDFGALVQHYPQAELILVDIPIGLPEPNGGRQCDRQARAELEHPRSRSIFPAPLRQIVNLVNDGATYAQANNHNQALEGMGLSTQSFSLISKIIEVDTFMANRLQNINPIIREVHPEVCFWALNHGDAMVHSKRELAGIIERIQIIAGEGIDALNMLEAAHEHIPVGVGWDDFCDALVAAITAFLGHDHLNVLGLIGQADIEGLPMEMVYWQPQ